MMEWLIYLLEWMHFVLRHARDARLGQHVDRVMYPGPKKKAKPHMARRYIALMADPEFRQRHNETLIRAGH